MLPGTGGWSSESRSLFQLSRKIYQMKLLEDVKNAHPYGSKQKMRDILIVTGRTAMEFFP